jgi:hypothetical protein
MLKDAGVSPNYRVGGRPGNHIADVAQAMEPGAAFAGVPKTLETYEAYQQAVHAFLVRKGAL